MGGKIARGTSPTIGARSDAAPSAGMKDKYSEYIVDDNWKLVRLLEKWGVSLFFSGHYHASSVVRHVEGPGSWIIDVETGSLVTWPCSYRTVTLSGVAGGQGSVGIRTDRISQLPSYAQAGLSFDPDGKRVIGNGIANVGRATMLRYRVPERDIVALTPAIVDAMMAHYAGDAHFEGKEMLPSKGLSLMGWLVTRSYDTFIKGLWKVQAPRGVELMEDNNLLIRADGSWSALPAPGKESPSGR